MQKTISGLRLGIGIVVLAAALGCAGLWMSSATVNEISTGTKISAGVGAIVLVFVVGIKLRNRWRRRLMDLRDSALW